MLLQEVLQFQHKFGLHYTAGLEGCGPSVEADVRNSYYALIRRLVHAFRSFCHVTASRSVFLCWLLWWHELFQPTSMHLNLNAILLVHSCPVPFPLGLHALPLHSPTFCYESWQNGLPRWLRWLRHSVHRLEQSVGKSQVNSRFCWQILSSDSRGTWFEINFSGRQTGFDGAVYNLWPLADIELSDAQ